MTLRALLVDHAPVLGGAERSLLHLVARLPAHGVAVEVVTGRGPLAEAAARAGAPVHHLDLPRLRGRPRPREVLGAVRRLRELLAGAVPTVAVANTTRAAPYVAAATLGTRAPFVWYVRDLSLSEGPARRPTLDFALRRVLQGAARSTIAVSHAVRCGLPARAGVVVVPNGVEIPPPDADGAGFRHRWRLSPEAAVVGVVGRLRSWKGQHRFLEALAPLARDLPHLRLVVAGTGGDDPDRGHEERLRDLAATPALKGRVVFCADPHVPHAVYGALDVLVHPGDPEPFGLAVAEAMSHGVPVAGFAHGALPELVDDGETGVLVCPGDLEGLRAAVAGLLSDAPRRARLGAAARGVAAARFDADDCARRVAAALRRAAGEDVRDDRP